MGSFESLGRATLLLMPLLVAVTMAAADSRTIGQIIDEQLEKVKVIDDKMSKIKTTMSHMSRQMMLQQMFVEERIRSDGNSGVKQTRLTEQGSKSYHSNTYTGKRAVAIHDHANHLRTVGMGEFVAVLNGVEFRTRHNDYKLVTPATITANNTIDYNKVEDIPFTDVPPSVLAKATVDEQIKEMREYFRAFAEQNETIRDYKKYFKPILCYLEGGWTQSTEDKIDESFDSDRHQLDAASWLDLQEKVRYTSYTGRKDRFENYAYLPTTIMKVVDGMPILAQWNYRIVCHPLKNDLPTSNLKLVDDIEVRLALKMNINKYGNSRSARFRMAPKNSKDWKEGIYRYDLMDQLMAEIPGKNGYGANMVDDGISGSRAKDFTNPDKDLNSAYYHRWMTGDRDAMGSRWQHRGYADDSLFVATTTQEKIAPLDVTVCRKKVCKSARSRVTYAIPLEIIYLNPLQNWNPYNIEYKHNESPKVNGKTGRSQQSAFAHATKDVFDRCPLSFFKSNKFTGDSADTSNGFFWIKDNKGVPQKVVASGLRVKLPQIEGIANNVRLRYPVMPIHQEGSVEWKRLQALEEYARGDPFATCTINSEC